MKADTSSMKAMLIANLRAGEAPPFPLYLHLPRNGRMVPICSAGELPAPALLAALLARGVEELWVPEGFEEALAQFEEVAASKERAATLPDERTAEKPNDPSAALPNDRTAALPEDPRKVFEEAGRLLAGNEPAAMQELAGQALRRLVAQAESSEEACAEAEASCRALADALLARRRDPFFESVRMLRSLQPSTHHSVAVGSFAAALHSALGGDPDLGAELVAAGTLHDIGLSLIPRDEPKLGAEYEAHVETAVALLRACTDPVPERVIELVRDHHERQDKPGFPSARAASKLREGSELLIMANVFDDLCTGAETGSRLSPRDALAWLREHSPAGPRGLEALNALEARELGGA